MHICIIHVQDECLSYLKKYCKLKPPEYHHCKEV